MTSFISKLSAICVENNIINEADVPWLEYGIETRITAIIGLVPFTILAIKLSDIPTTLAFLATFNFLRKRVGGYHANSVLGCMLLSLFLEVLFLGAFLPKLNMVVFFISNGVSLAIIYFMAPYVHPNMNFSKDEIYALHNSAKRRVMQITVFTLACYFFNFSSIAKGLTAGTAMTAFMLCLAYFL